MFNMNWNCPLPRYGRPDVLAAWLQQQIDRCDDADFGQRFADGRPVSGVTPAEYQHRRVSVNGQSLLVGIRYKGGDLTHPFVDLLAWTGAVQPRWLEVVAEEFAVFQPQAVRYCLAAGVSPLDSAIVDQHLVAGPAVGVEDSEIAPARDLAWYDEFLWNHAAWSGNSPLGREVRPADRESLQACLEQGRIVAALRGGAFVGVAASRRQSIRSISGWEVVEEFVIPEAQGQGLGARLQRSLMHRLPPGDCVWGTIHGANTASLVTARKCGREIVETWWMSPLGDSTGADL